MNMSIRSLPTDPVPTEAELTMELAEFRSECPGGKQNVLRCWADLSWKLRKQKDNANTFLVPFADWIEWYPEDCADYRSYLRSPLWKSIRQKILEEAGYECACCSNTASTVHHRDYRPRVLAGDDLTPLVALCAECHETIDKENGRRREVYQEKERTLCDLAARKAKKSS